jgi:hypothetical protein
MRLASAHPPSNIAATPAIANRTCLPELRSASLITHPTHKQTLAPTILFKARPVKGAFKMNEDSSKCLAS